MRMERSPFSAWELLLLFGPLPALVALAAAIAVEAIPLPTLLAIGIIAYAGLVAGTMEARKDARRSTRTAPEAMPALELVNTIPLTIAPATIGVARTTGICPLGFRKGSAWTVYQDGNLTYPLCRPAVEALGSVLHGSAAGEARSEVACRCPIADQEVVFTIAMNGRRERLTPQPGVRGEAHRADESPAA